MLRDRLSSRIKPALDRPSFPDQSLPDTMKTDDFQPNSGWVVAVVSSKAELEAARQNPVQLMQQGKTYEQKNQIPAFRFYALFRF